MHPDQVWNLIAKKLTKEASPEDLAELEGELRLNPELHYSLQAVTDFWESHPSIQIKFAERAYNHHVDRMRALGVDFSAPIEPLEETIATSSFGSRSRKKILGIAAIGIACAWIGVFFFQQHNSSTPIPQTEKRVSEISTHYGTKTSMLLPDGSSVMLNAGSKLTYDSAYGRKLREVTLTGEGFFDVVKNAEKPFVIHTGNINIRVLGTAFNVRSYPSEKTIETSLIRGSIEVTFSNEKQRKVILKPNQKLIVNNAEPDALPDPKQQAEREALTKPVSIDKLSHFGPDSLVTETAWVQNKLVFQDKSFVEVAEMMERWYDVKILLDDASLDTLHLTGDFQKENIEQALNALRLLSKFNYRIQNNEVHLVKTK